MTTKTHDPDNSIFTRCPDPPYKHPKVYGIWQQFKENFAGHEPDVVYFDYSRMLWVIEIDGTEHTVS